jgi:hypothetical protein
MKISGFEPSTTSLRVTQPGMPTSKERFSPGASSIVTGEVPIGFPLRNSRAPGGLTFTTTVRVPSAGALDALGAAVSLAAAAGAGSLGAALGAGSFAAAAGALDALGSPAVVALGFVAAVGVSGAGIAAALGLSAVARGAVSVVAGAAAGGGATAAGFSARLCRYQRPPMMSAAITRLTISQREMELPVSGGGTETLSGAF